jgi:hypothetical protein
MLDHTVHGKSTTRYQFIRVAYENLPWDRVPVLRYRVLWYTRENIAYEHACMHAWGASRSGHNFNMWDVGGEFEFRMYDLIDIFSSGWW